MNEIVNNFLLAGDKFMLEMHLGQPEFTYSAYSSFTKFEKRVQKFKETRDSWHFHQNKLDEACFQQGMAYRDLPRRRTASDKVLREKAFTTAKNPKYDRYQRGLASMIYTFFSRKKTCGGAVKSEIMSNQELTKVLHKPIIRKFEKWKKHLSFTDNTWGADLK